MDFEKIEKRARRIVERELLAGLRKHEAGTKGRAQVRKWAREDFARIDSAVTAGGPLEWLSLHVTWNRSRSWGNCPRVELRGGGGGRTWTAGGYASGCGYDKLSAAVCEALEKCPPAFRLLLENWTRAAREKSAAHKAAAAGVYRSRPYGVLECFRGRGLPSFSMNGMGWSTVRGLLEWCGLKCITEDRAAKYSDYFYFERRGRR